MTIVVALTCVAVLLGLAVVAVALSGSQYASRTIYSIAAAISVIALGAALLQLLTGNGSPSVILPLGLPWLGAHFRIDNLSAFFLILVNLGATFASVFAIGYGEHEEAPHRVLPFYPAFLAGMNLVVLADDAFSFLISWEFMSLASWALVMTNHRESDNRYAAYVYLVMASAGTMALLLTFGLLAGPDGHYGFSDIRSATLAPALASLTLGLALVGAGSKAGLFPLHVWLPLAHPAAPSHVSALMSGVMTKVAIYGFIRIVFDLLGPPQWWWSMPILALGGITAVMGLLYALLQSDMKRLLAYSTVENVGIIFTGLGLALAFKSYAMPAAAALAMTAALFHALNHTMFKSLLFFGAGAILTGSGERNIERLGGLIHRMPQTAFAFLVGSVAISALPPFNGFVSEWLMFQAILLSPMLPSWGLKFLVPATGALLALAAALAAACFVRAFGVTFLGRPRSSAAETAHEVDAWSLTAMFGFGALCLLAGIFPSFFIDAMAPVVDFLVGGRMPTQAGVGWLAIMPVAESRSSYDGLLVFLFIAFSATLAAAAIHRLASDRLRRAPLWACGYPELDGTMQYTASSLAQPIRRVFGATLFLAREQIDMPAPGDLRPARFQVVVRDLVWETLYAPVADGVVRAADKLNRIQFLTIRQYLSLVFALLVVLLLVLAIWS